MEDNQMKAYSGAIKISRWIGGIMLLSLLTFAPLSVSAQCGIENQGSLL